MADVLSISSSAVGVYQRVLGVVSNNIANVGNEGYVRQDAEVGQTPPTFDGRNFLGTGAAFEGVRRQYNGFIETSLRNASASLSGQQSMVSYAERVMDVLGSGEIGLSPAMDRFFSAARALAADPATTISRTSLLREAEGVASRFRDLASQMAQIESETQQAMSSDLAQVNSLAHQLGKVNLELSRARELERQPSALLDERDRLLRDLSKFINISVTEADNGVVSVAVGGAGSSGALVSGQIVRPLEASFDPQAPERLNLLLDPYGREPVTISGVTGGSFGGLSAFRAQVLEPALSNLDLLAKTFLTEVNRVHTSGVDGYGQTGQPMFDVQTQFGFQRIVGTNPMALEARVSDLQAFDGKDITLSFDAQAGQVYSAALLGPFEQGDRFEVSVNGLDRTFTIGGDTSPAGVSQQLRQFIDGAFGVQLRASVDPNGQVLIDSSVMKSFSLEIKLSSDEGRVQMGQSQGLWVATNRAGERITGANALLVDGVTVNLRGQAVDGEQVIVKSVSRPAAGLRMLIEDPARVAAAASFRVSRSQDNISTVNAVVLDRIDEPTGDSPAPVLGSSKGLSNNPVPSEAVDWVAQRVVPFASIAAGQRDVAIYLDPGSSQANLQVLTREGRHLLGTTQADGASFVSSVNTLPAPFVSGSTYSAAYLNQTGTAAYRDLSLFYGARAKPVTVDVMGVDHVPVATTQRPARLAAELGFKPGAFSLPDDALVLNGVPLSARQGVFNEPQDVASMLQAAIEQAREDGTEQQRLALAGVAVEVQDGVVQFTRSPDMGPAGAQGLIELGFGSEGTPRLLADLGFRTAAHLDGEMPEDLLVFTTGSGDVKLSASFSGVPMNTGDQREGLRANALDIVFTTATRYRIVDVTTNTIVAERDHSAQQPIDYRGLRVVLSAAPKAGDVFRLDGNQDGRGDNGNASRLVDLERESVAGPGRSLNMSDAYLEVVDQISNVTQQSQVATRALEVVHQQAVEARESVSGVSLDEEAANLIRFQQAYQAAAKSMQVASQMFEAVLGI